MKVYGDIKMNNICWALKYIKERKFILLIANLLIIINVFFELSQTILQKYILDKMIYVQSISQILVFIGILLLAHIGTGVLFYFIGLLYHNIFYNWRNTMVNILYSKIEKLDLTNYENERVAKFVVLFSDIEQRGNELFRLPYKLGNVIKLFLISCILLKINILIFSIMTVLNSISIIFNKGISKAIKENEVNLENSKYDIQTKFEEGISGTREILVYEYESNFVKKIKDLFSNYLKKAYKFIKIKNIAMSLTSVIKWSGTFLSILIAWKMESKGAMAIGTFYMVYQFSNQFNDLFKQVSDTFVDLVRDDAKFQKLRDAIDNINEINFNTGIQLTEPIQSIEFQKVCHSYGERDVLYNFDESILIGKKNLVIGSSGSGKTTVACLLLKSYPISRGRCLINNRYSINDINLSSWLKKVTVVYQDSYLFPGTIRSNIVLGNQTITDETIMWFCEKMQIKDFICELPKGLDESIGERGVNISGGQRQRLSLVRALVRNTEIFILDEATSALDEKTEKIVLKNLDEILKGKTLIIIAHKLSAILNADKKIYLEKIY